MTNTRSVNKFASPGTQQERRHEPKFLSPRSVSVPGTWGAPASLEQRVFIAGFPLVRIWSPRQVQLLRVLAVSSPCGVPTIARSAAEAHDRSDPRDEKLLAGALLCSISLSATSLSWIEQRGHSHWKRILFKLPVPGRPCLHIGTSETKVVD